MLDRLFPRSFDNAYRGRWLAIWIFVPIVLLKAIQGINSIVLTRSTAINADGIPLATFSAVAAQTVLSMFALLGFYLLILPLQSIVVLVRYRAMVPFMYLMLLIMQLGGRAILLANSNNQTGPTPIGVYVNLSILALTIVGFVLSIWDRKGAG